MPDTHAPEPPTSGPLQPPAGPAGRGRAPRTDVVREAIVTFLSAHPDENFTNREILDEIERLRLPMKYPAQYMDELARLAREHRIQRVHLGLYTMPSSGQIHNKFKTRRSTPRTRRNSGQMYELIAVQPLLVRSPDGKIYRLVEQ